MTASKAVQLDAGPRELRAGPLRAWWTNGELRYLRVGGAEVVRRIFVAVRDSAWGTIPGKVTGAVIQARCDGFTITYEVRHVRGDIDFAWRGTIAAFATDPGAVAVEFEMVGVPLSTFLTNRTGVSVLHPIREVAGCACRIEHSDGTVEASRFPRSVEPCQPFRSIRAMEYDAGGAAVRLGFDGEVFETEDQRNWADGSYKTYCRPLDLPFPYPLTKGQRVRQGVTVRIEAKHEGAASSGRDSVRVGGLVGQLPRLGVAVPAGQERRLTSDDQNRRWLKALNFAHLRADVFLTLGSDREVAMETLARVADDVGVTLELALHVASGAGLEMLPRLAGRYGARVSRWLVYEEGSLVTPAECAASVRELLRGTGLIRPIVGGGTGGNFAELNRNRPAAGSLDVVTYPICPQVHATDDWSLVENLEAFGDMVRTARAFVGTECGINVAPLMLHRRPDPFAKGMSGGTEPVLPDPRQKGLFGAAWTLGAIAQLAAAGADFVTCYDAIGPFGVMDAGVVFPLYHVLADIGAFSGAAVLNVSGIDRPGLAVLAMRKQNRTRVMIANLTDREREVDVHVTSLGHSAAVRRLNERALDAATRGPENHLGADGEHIPSMSGLLVVALAPWEVATVDFEGGDA
jgi:hypothetical protein